MVLTNTMTIANLKVLIHKRTDMQVPDLRLLCAGRDLRDTDTIHDSGLVECSIIIAVLRLRGGKNHDDSSDDDEEFDNEELPQFIPLETHESALQRWNAI